MTWSLWNHMNFTILQFQLLFLRVSKSKSESIKQIRANKSSKGVTPNTITLAFYDHLFIYLVYLFI